MTPKNRKGDLRMKKWKPIAIILIMSLTIPMPAAYASYGVSGSDLALYGQEQTQTQNWSYSQTSSSDLTLYDQTVPLSSATTIEAWSSPDLINHDSIWILSDHPTPTSAWSEPDLNLYGQYIQEPEVETNPIDTTAPVYTQTYTTLEEAYEIPEDSVIRMFYSAPVLPDMSEPDFYGSVLSQTQDIIEAQTSKEAETVSLKGITNTANTMLTNYYIRFIIENTGGLIKVYDAAENSTFYMPVIDNTGTTSEAPESLNPIAVFNIQGDTLIVHYGHEIYVIGPEEALSIDW